MGIVVSPRGERTLLAFMVAVCFIAAAMGEDLDAVPHCLKYTDETTKMVCKICEPAFFLQGGRCEACIEHCTDCESAVDCKHCQRGFYLGEKGESCLQCEPQCTTCTSKYICTECSHGYFFSIRTCVTDKVLLLFYYGSGLLCISGLAILACIFRFCCASQSDSDQDITNLFQGESD